MVPILFPLISGVGKEELELKLFSGKSFQRKLARRMVHVLLIPSRKLLVNRSEHGKSVGSKITRAATASE
jgi:hypothetical protein